MAVVTKRSSMTFFSSSKDHLSHRVRIVLAEKGVAADLIEVDPDNKPAEIADLNPYNSLPTMVDRDLVLYETNGMMEYLDERFPHPPLLPVYPVSRAQTRLWIYRIEREWSPLVEIITQEPTSRKADKARKELRESIIGVSPVFAECEYFMSDEFSLADCCVLPILWRLNSLGIDIPKAQTEPLHEYMKKCFSREAFQDSLTQLEKEMRPQDFVH